MKFSGVTQRSLPVYYALIDAIADRDALLLGTVVDQTKVGGLAWHGRQPWEISRDVSTRLIHGAINQGEIVTVIMDQFSTPVGVAIDEQVRTMVNKRLHRLGVTSATCLDSRSTDLLQAADMVAGAVAFDRRRRAGQHGSDKFSLTSPKAKVVQRLMQAFDVTDFGDRRSARLNVATVGCGSPPGRATLRAVPGRAS